jgi:hypothetical protein
MNLIDTLWVIVGLVVLGLIFLDPKDHKDQ